MESKALNTNSESKELGVLLLDLGINLLQAGASCSRISGTVTRVAKAYHYTPHVAIGAKSVSVTLDDKDGQTLFNSSRSTSKHGIDFNLISAISELSHKAEEKGYTVQQLRKELNESKVPGQYSRLVTLCFVSLAGASFCFTFGGSPIELMITFIATFCGLFTKQQTTKYGFNTYICTYLAATVASLIVAIFHVAGLTVSPVNAFATCVLFLIPGVLLINCFTDLIDGNTVNGIEKGASALIYALAIAFGLVTTILIFNLNK